MHCPARAVSLKTEMPPSVCVPGHTASPARERAVQEAWGGQAPSLPSLPSQDKALQPHHHQELRTTPAKWSHPGAPPGTGHRLLPQKMHAWGESSISFFCSRDSGKTRKREKLAGNGKKTHYSLSKGGSEVHWMRNNPGKIRINGSNGQPLPTLLVLDIICSLSGIYFCSRDYFISTQNINVLLQLFKKTINF